LDYYTHPVICFTDDKELDAQQIETEETPSGKIAPANTMQFPNDLIVQYIKELNEQYHTLTERSRRALKKVEALPAYKNLVQLSREKYEAKKWTQIQHSKYGFDGRCDDVGPK